LEVLYHRIEATVFWVVHGGTRPYPSLYQFSRPVLDATAYVEPVVLDLDVSIRFRVEGRLLDDRESLPYLARAINALDDWKEAAAVHLPREPRGQTIDLRDCCLSASNTATGVIQELSTNDIPCQDLPHCDEWQCLTIEHEDRPSLSFTGRLLAEVDGPAATVAMSGPSRYPRYQVYETPGERYIVLYQSVSTYPGERTTSFSEVVDREDQLRVSLGNGALAEEVMQQIARTRHQRRVPDTLFS